MSLRLKNSILPILMALPLAAAANDQQGYSSDHDSQRHSSRSLAPLVKKVRDAVSRYTKAERDAYKAVITPCVSGPEFGAMGVHFVNAGLLDGKLDAEHPEALIYEPQSDGRLRLVGVEFIVPKAAWEAENTPEPGKLPTPSLEGHLLHLVGAPNRYGLDPFYEIHVWAFEHNPIGDFADWNTQVTCEKQRLLP
jgi:hypothetical protein